MIYYHANFKPVGHATIESHFWVFFLYSETVSCVLLASACTRHYVMLQIHSLCRHLPDVLDSGQDSRLSVCVNLKKILWQIVFHSRVACDVDRKLHCCVRYDLYFALIWFLQITGNYFDCYFFFLASEYSSCESIYRRVLSHRHDIPSMFQVKRRPHQCLPTPAQVSIYHPLVHVRLVFLL